MTAYLFVQIAVHDRVRFLDYAAAARGIAPRFGARYLATGRPAQILEGDGLTTPLVLTEWPTVEAIHAFWNSPEYREAVKLRDGAATVSATIIDGNGEARVQAMSAPEQ